MSKHLKVSHSHNGPESSSSSIQSALCPTLVIFTDSNIASGNAHIQPQPTATSNDVTLVTTSVVTNPVNQAASNTAGQAVINFANQATCAVISEAQIPRLMAWKRFAAASER